MTAAAVPAEAGELNDEQEALASALGDFCQDRADVVRSASALDDFVTRLWTPLGALGVLALATPEGGGGAAEIAVAGSVLGRHGFPGPLVATVLAGQVLHDERRPAVLDGRALTAIGPALVTPWAADAVAFFELEGGDIWLGEPAGPMDAVSAIGGEPAARVALKRTVAVAGAARALALADVAAAAFLTGAGLQLVDGAAAYARDRRQFGRPIGDFQGVAFPLADVHARLAAAADLTWAAATSLDCDGVGLDAGDSAGRFEAAAARLSARRAALESVYACHQVYGAMGFTEEGPMAVLRRRIAQTALLPPGPEALERVVLEGWRTPPG